MSHRGKKFLEAQARSIARQDSKFVAKLSGVNYRTAEASGDLINSLQLGNNRSGTPQPEKQQLVPCDAAASSTSAGQSISTESSPVHDATQAAVLQTRHRTASPLRSVSPDFQPPDIRPAWEKAAELVTHDGSSSPDAPQLITAAARGPTPISADVVTALSLDVPPASALSAPCSAEQQVSALVRELDEQLVASTWLGSCIDAAQHQTAAQQHTSRAQSPGGPESPSWWVKATSGANVRVKPGPIQKESSLYSSWARTYSPDSTADSKAVPTAITPAAVGIQDTAAWRSPRGLTVPGTSTSTAPGELCNAAKAACRAQTAAASIGREAVSTAPAAVDVSHTCSSPCGSNLYSSRAAGMVAGISKPGMNLKYQTWLTKQYPGAKPPRREDAESVRLWLQQQLTQLHQQLQQDDADVATDSCNQQRMPQEAQQILQSIQPRSILQAQQQRLKSQQQAGSPPELRPGSSGPCGAALHAAACLGSSAADGLQQWQDAGLEAQTSQLLLMTRQADGGLDVGVLQQQEHIYTAVFNELCRQVSVQCVERGHLMAQLWIAERGLMLTALADRQAARAGEAAAYAASSTAQDERDSLHQLQEDERVALRAICERHAAKAEAAKHELDKLQKKHQQLQDLLQRLSGAQQLVQRVMDLESLITQQQATISTLQQQLHSSEKRTLELTDQLVSWQTRSSTAEQHAAELEQQLMVSTPRPRRDLGLLTDLLTPEEAHLVEQALITGVPVEHVHRLLLGLTPEGEDLRPWMKLAGCCTAALQSSADPYSMHQQLQQLINGCNAAGLSRFVQSPDSIQLIGQALHLGAAPCMVLQLVDGSLGLPCSARQLAAAASKMAAEAAEAATAAQATAGRRTSSATRRVLMKTTSRVRIDCTATQQGALQSSDARSAANDSSKQQQACADDHRSQQDLRVQQVVASIGTGMPYVPLIGVLATKYGHDANELGGPVTEALAHAQLSTFARIADLGTRTKEMHREVVLLKRTLAEQRKHEQERLDNALKDQKRRIARREARQPSLLDKFLQTKWGDYFMGIGLMDELPRVLRANVPINNKKMPKREAEKLAREIWQVKDEQEQAGAPRQHLADVTAAFLERRYFAIPRLITEVSYNFIYSLGQHSYDADCNLFLRVFTGDIEETVRHEQQAMEAEIMRLLKLLDVSINHAATGWLHKADVKTALAGFFKGKSIDRLNEIYEALDTDEAGDAVHYPGLFTDDDDMNQGMTAETIRSQHLQERLEFLQDVENSIRDMAEDNNTTSLTPAMLRTCLEKTTRKIDSATVEAFVARAFGPNWHSQLHRMALPLGQVIRSIRKGSLQPALCPTASTAATAISKIAAVGKFKTKLISALKVGLNEPVSARRPSDSNGPAQLAVGSGAVGVNNISRRRSVGKNSTGSGQAGDAGYKTSRASTCGAARSRRATQDAVSAAVAAVLAGSQFRAGSCSAEQQQKLRFSMEGDGTPADDAAAAVASDIDADEQQHKQTQQDQEQQQTENVQEPAAASSSIDNMSDNQQQRQQQGSDAEVSDLRSSTADSTQEEQASTSTLPDIHQRSKAVSKSSSLRRCSSDAAGRSHASSSVGSVASKASSTHTVTAGSSTSRLGQTAVATVGPSTQQPAMTVGMLSALEAVRQSWLKEEEERIVQASMSGAGAAAAISTGGSTATSMFGASSPSAAGRLSVANFFLNTSSGASAGGGSLLNLPNVNSPTAAAADGAGFAGSLSGNGSSTGGYRTGTTFRIPDIPALQLDKLGDGVEDCSGSIRSPGKLASSARGGEGAGSSRIIKPILRQMDSVKSPKRVHIDVPEEVSGSPPRSPLNKAANTGQRFNASSISAQDQVSPSRSSASAQGLTAAESRTRNSSAGNKNINCRGTSSSATTSSVEKPPMLALTDADDVILSSSGGTGLDGWAGAADDACYTPNAPAEGGKVNAIAIRRIAKGKSLKRLEDVMLMVASNAAEVAPAVWD